jgi:Ca2+-binding RTX toxin-like protein
LAVITGGAGDDSMDGGLGNDLFVFAPGFGHDTIAGFNAAPNVAGAQDRLDISGLGIKAENFASSVTIGVVDGNTLVTIGEDSILRSTSPGSIRTPSIKATSC